MVELFIIKTDSREIKMHILFWWTRTGIWTEGLVLARQVLYYLSHTTTLLALVIFQIRACSFFFFLVVLGLELRTYTLSHSTSPLFLCV
jgi:hypothetical protein